MIFVHMHYYLCTPCLVDFIATYVVSGNAKAFDFGATRVDLIEVNVDLSLHISMGMSMHTSQCQRPGRPTKPSLISENFIFMFVSAKKSACPRFW